MTIAATAWAFSTDVPQSPLERLLLVLLADDMDDFGVCVTRLDDVAALARMTREGVIDVLAEMSARRVVCLLSAVEGQSDPEIAGFDLLLFNSWHGRRGLATDVSLPDQASVRHPIYGSLVLA